MCFASIFHGCFHEKFSIKILAGNTVNNKKPGQLEAALI
jgi:hypothetical protein